MKRLLLVALMLFAITFAACKKAEETPDQGKKQKTGQMNDSEAAKKKGKRGPGAGLEIYQEEKLVATIASKEYAGIATSSVKVDGTEYKAILLTDLLKKYNVTGKSITLKGPAKETSLTWEQVSANPIYVYVVKKRLQLYQDSKALQDVKLPTVLIRVTAAEKLVEPAPTQAKGAKKTTT